MGLASPDYDQFELDGSYARIYSCLEESFTLSDDFSEPEVWRTDLYGNRYLLSPKNDLVKVEPSLEDVLEETESVNRFGEEMKHVLAYFTNFYSLDDESVSVPDFEIGVYRDEEDLSPYMVMEKPEGRPLSDIPAILEEDEELKAEFERYNRKGRRLSAGKKIIYPEKRENTDMIVDPDSGRLRYINPGTYYDPAFYGQFMRNEKLPDPNGIGRWCGERFWKERI